MFCGKGNARLDGMAMAHSYTTRVESLRGLIELYDREVTMLGRDPPSAHVRSSTRAVFYLPPGWVEEAASGRRRGPDNPGRSPCGTSLSGLASRCGAAPSRDSGAGRVNPCTPR